MEEEASETFKCPFCPLQSNKKAFVIAHQHFRHPGLVQRHEESVVVRVPPPDTADDNPVDEPVTIEVEYAIPVPEVSNEDVRSLQWWFL
ncbi:hypothetical protein Pcinc_027633 [Petrolisthes cinctipes]|uniref:Uncharacterized protein n=1 Tax=Petrolisthes cinctipes TaxID=88211 RepID=A0AAE1F4Q6_PETCI|nr:hypothetical protein Pcinc_027633 [Petrolisthes cinctipes]